MNFTDVQIDNRDVNETELVIDVEANSEATEIRVDISREQVLDLYMNFFENCIEDETVLKMMRNQLEALNKTFDYIANKEMFA